MSIATPRLTNEVCPTDKTLTLNIRIKKINVTPVVPPVVPKPLDDIGATQSKEKASIFDMPLNKSSLDGPLVNLTTKSGITFKVIDNLAKKPIKLISKVAALEKQPFGSVTCGYGPSGDSCNESFTKVATPAKQPSGDSCESPTKPSEDLNLKGNYSAPVNATTETIVHDLNLEATVNYVHNLKPIKQIKIKGKINPSPPNPNPPNQNPNLPNPNPPKPINLNPYDYETSEYDLLDESLMDDMSYDGFDMSNEMDAGIDMTEEIEDDTQIMVRKLPIFGKYFWVGCDKPNIYDPDTMQKVGFIKPNLDVEFY